MLPFLKEILTYSDKIRISKHFNIKGMLSYLNFTILVVQSLKRT